LLIFLEILLINVGVWIIYLLLHWQLLDRLFLLDWLLLAWLLLGKNVLVDNLLRHLSTVMSHLGPRHTVVSALRSYYRLRHLVHHRLHHLELLHHHLHLLRVHSLTPDCRQGSHAHIWWCILLGILVGNLFVMVMEFLRIIILQCLI
jgi:hypothetical protein